MRVRVDHGTGTPVLLLHGQPGSAADFSRVVPLLEGEGVRVLAVDRPGYGAHDGPARGLAGNAAALVALLDALGIGRAVLLGWSWGGGVALATALAAPERVAGMVLAGSIGHPASVGAVDRLLAAPGVRRLMAPVMERLGPRGVKLLQATSGSRLDQAALRLFAAEAALWPATGAWTSAAVEQVAMVAEVPALGERLGAVACPVTVLHGWHDETVDVRAGVALAAALPAARLVGLDAGHLLPFERPDVLVSELLALVAALPGTA